MAYRTDNKIKKYVKGYGFISFAKNIGSKEFQLRLNLIKINMEKC